MPSLRDYRDRIKSVKSTKKITSAMKMVAASKLRRAQDQAEASQPYAQTMAAMLARVAQNIDTSSADIKLLRGTGQEQRYLVIVMTADRGLCGGFNANVVKKARQRIAELIKAGKDVSIVCVGRKGYDLMVREMSQMIAQQYNGVTSKKRLEFVDAHNIADYILSGFEFDEFDVCEMHYNKFRSVLVQEPSAQQLIPFEMSDNIVEAPAKKSTDSGFFPYEFEPSEEEILSKLLPKNIAVQIFRALLDSAAGEQAARMTAMENATSNAGDMIKDLTLQYNRARQAYITKELIEIISGAEAV